MTVNEDEAKKYFGSGPALDRQLDLVVNPTGDLKKEEGIDELKKDLAIQMMISLSTFLGRPPSGNLQAKISNTVKRVALDDERINSVVEGSVDVSFSDDRKEIDVSLSVRTQNGPQTLIFNI